VVWEWRRGQQLATVTGGGDVIYDIAFDPYQTNVIVSCGTRNVRFWALSGNVLQAKKGQFGKVRVSILWAMCVD
jgi:WD40 repeat protein